MFNSKRKSSTLPRTKVLSQSMTTVPREASSTNDDHLRPPQLSSRVQKKFSSVSFSFFLQRKSAFAVPRSSASEPSISTGTLSTEFSSLSKKPPLAVVSRSVSSPSSKLLASSAATQFQSTISSMQAVVQSSSRTFIQLHLKKKTSMPATIAKVIGAQGREGATSPVRGIPGKPPLLRSRTLPAIIIPPDLQQQIEFGLEGTHKVAPTEPPIRPLVTITTHDDTTRIILPPRDDWECTSPGNSTGGLKVPGMGSQSSGLGRFARLLTKEPRVEGEFRRRTHSLESKLGPSIRRAASIDSLVDATNNNHTFFKNIAVVKNGSIKSNNIPGSPTVSKRSFRGADKQNVPGWSNMDVLVDGLNLSKADKKKLEKVNNFNIHLRALFAAVEYDQVEKARNILQNNTFDVNSVNADGLNVLEVAVMTGNASIIKTLQQAGATENNKGSVEQRLKDLDELVLTAERRRDELTQLMVGGNYPKETEKQQALWDRRSRILRKMRLGLEKLNVPAPPRFATVEVIDGTRVRVGFQEPPFPSPITTKFKVEWSVDNWATLKGSRELFDLRRLFAVIDRLAQGCRHHFRVYAGNMKGYSAPIETSPSSTVPSSWRDIDNRSPRLEGLIQELEDLFKQVRNSRPEHASEIKTLELGQETPIVQRKAQKKKSLMQLFTHAPKFQKSLKRGSYLACIVYCEDKILVTTEDFPPVIEVDENYLSQAKLHFHWLMKVATTWEDVKSLRQDMEQAGSASHLPYRIKLLQAAANMQSILGIQDLGQFYHKPIKDSSGTYVFCTVKHVKSSKAISTMNVRWVPLSKLKERKISNTQGSSPSPTESKPTAGGLLINSIPEQIGYSQISQLPLKRGLYLGYMKLQSSVEQLQVIVPERIPNMFPHIKIRDNPHVSREEWEWIQSLKQKSWSKSEDPGGGDIDIDPIESKYFNPSSAQKVWQKQLTTAVHRLLQDIGVETEKYGQHRLYTGEVLDLNCDVTLLLLFPPVEEVCCAPGQEDALLSQPNLMALPLHTFEMVHMGTYQDHLLGKYARLSYILEMDTLMAQHASREAFSEVEVSKAKDRLNQLKQFQVLLDAIWKQFRWVMDAISFARDKAVPGIQISALSSSLEAGIKERIYSVIPLDAEKTSLARSDPSISSSKRFRKDLHKKKHENLRLVKSNTNEDVNISDPSDCYLPKSKTSECIYYSNSSLHYSDPDQVSEEYIYNESSSDNIPQIKWQSKLYDKDDITSKSDYLLDKSGQEVELPPRKSSAPSFLGQDLTYLRPKSPSEDYKMSSNQSSVSLDCLDKPNEVKESSVLEMEVDYIVPPADKTSPSTSCSDIGLKYSCSGSYVSDKRTSSSMSHGSEASFSSINASLRSVSSTETDAVSLISKESGRSEGDEERKRSNEPAIIQVFAAYETGLASGTSVKLHITPRTTAREVIDLVVKQLNIAVVLKNKTGPNYGNEKLNDFCLVAVIGARERCLRDDFKPLQLQNPWIKGRLYVRLKHDVLAALEQSNSRHSSYL